MTNETGSFYDKDACYGYESESAWNARYRRVREAIHKATLPRSLPSTLSARQQVDAFSLEVTRGLSASGFTLLADGYVDASDGFPSIGDPREAYHRSLIFHLTGQALLLVVKPYYYLHSDGSGGSPSVSLYLAFESLEVREDNYGEDPVLFPGFHGCGASRGYRPESRRIDVSVSYEDNVYGKGMPDTQAFLSAAKDAVDSIKQLETAPFESRVWMGNYVDTSNWFCTNGGHTKTNAHKMFWKRTNGGKQRVLEVAPGAMFTKIYPHEKVAGPEVGE